jgi:ribosomal protein L29
MTRDEIKLALAEISNLKKEQMMSRIKASSGDLSAKRGSKKKKKEVARIFTKINSKTKSK